MRLGNFLKFTKKILMCAWIWEHSPLIAPNFPILSLALVLSHFFIPYKLKPVLYVGCPSFWKVLTQSLICLSFLMSYIPPRH